MPFFKRDKERQRFYLFAGMGGRSARRKHRLILKWSIAIGIVVSLVLGTLLYIFNKPGL